MTSKTLARIIGRVDKALAKATQLALTEIEKEARKAIEASPDTIKSFCMATGNAAFHVVWLADGEPMPREENIDPGKFKQYGHINAHADNVAKLIDEYNCMLRLTGYPLKIVRDDKGELTKLNDW